MKRPERLYQGKGGIFIRVDRCMECPRFSRCPIGFWQNDFPASGVIPKNCHLEKVRRVPRP